MKHILTLKTAAGITCTTFALAAGAQTNAPEATTPAGNSETLGQHIDDAAITTKVKADLLASDSVKSEHIHVRTRNGVVLLTGTVPTALDRDSATQVVQNVSGVTSVRNKLKVASE
jgi:hyperosmotically inducible periplasmic protein